MPLPLASRFLILSFAVAVASNLLAGCNSSASDTSKITPESFRGDPSKMPADAMKQVEQAKNKGQASGQAGREAPR